jgi:hypothetical protein
LSAISLRSKKKLKGANENAKKLLVLLINFALAFQKKHISYDATSNG